MKIITCNKNIFMLLTAIWNIAIIAAAISTKTTTTTTPTTPCKQRHGMWGDVNPNIFYTCDAITNSALQLRCPEGSGFFNGFGYYGCIPYEQWPACIQTDDNRMHVCDGEHLSQPWETTNPNMFYVCLLDTFQPLLVNCEEGKGFVSAPVPEQHSRIVGCADWEKWRAYMKCEQFY